MWFLLLQIFLLLVVAALLGAALAYWWVKGRFEDVTESHQELRAQADRLFLLDGMATRDDLKAQVETLQAALKAARPDLQPLSEQMVRLEAAVGGIRIPEPDLGPVHQRLSAMEGGLGTVAEAVRAWRSPEVDLGPVHSGLLSVQLAVDELKASRADIDVLHGHMANIESRIAQLAEHLDGARKAGVDSILGRIGALSASVEAIRIPDAPAIEPHLTPLKDKLFELELAIASIRIPETDLGPTQAMLAEIDRSLASMVRTVDLKPVLDRFVSVEGQLAALAHFERRLAGLQEAVTGIGASMRDTDLAPVLDAVAAIDSRQDLVAVENRITAIEYSLAALHHMMRSRPEPRPEGGWQARPVATVAKDVKPPSAANGRPPREFDPINPVRREGDQANLLVEAAFGPADDLAAINGVGPILSSLLHDIGVHYYWQVAEWTPEEAIWVDSQLMHFRGRIKRDDWIGHARQLVTLPTAAKRPIGPSANRPL